LPNRTCFIERLQHVSGPRDPERCRGLLLLLVDLDRFKDVNDVLGHEHGDRLLCEVASRLKGNFRVDDLVARLDSDKFAILIAGYVRSEQSVEDAVARVTSAFAVPFDLEGLGVSIEASIGVSVSSGDGPAERDALLQQAEIALSAAKRGSDSHAVYRAEMKRANTDKLMLVSQLRAALDERQLFLDYQPIVDVASGKIVSAEALIRWNHPQRGLTLPTAFVPLIEQTGLIVPLTSFVLSEALRQLADWSAQGYDGSVSVNVSARNLLDEGFPALLEGLLEESGLRRDRLVLELTERSILVDSTPIRGILTELSQLGVRIAIDDFGTGYSSFAHLVTLPIAQLKIDRSFVTNAYVEPSSATIVSSIIELTHNLGLEIVGEGVESPADLAFLTSLGCDLAQGRHLGCPGPPDHLRRLFAPAAELTSRQAGGGELA
jgi:diguanylate cyclase (GGDEF)-like protein